jgi:hypothetical protein
LHTPPPKPHQLAQRCGFARIRGEGIDYVVRQYETTIGRVSKQGVDLPITDHAAISRRHATISYSFDRRRWELAVEGRNGVSLNGKLLTPASPGLPAELRSQDHLVFGDAAVWFLLPEGSAAAAAAAGAAAGAEQQQEGKAAAQQQPGAPAEGAAAAVPEAAGEAAPAAEPMQVDGATDAAAAAEADPAVAQQQQQQLPQQGGWGQQGDPSQQHEGANGQQQQ